MKRTGFIPGALIAMTMVFTGCKKDVIQNEMKDEALMKQANGLVITSWPSAQDPGLPFYARVEPAPPHVYHNGSYAVIVFYRSTAEIPVSFNLLNMFDPPAAFNASLRVSGTSLWQGNIGAGSPKVVNVQGNGATEVWFAPVPALLSLVQQQSSLTISELATMPGLIKGTAHQLQEVNHPHALPEFMGGGGHPVPKLHLNASGTLETGGSFTIELSAKQNASGWHRQTMISFN